MKKLIICGAIALSSGTAFSQDAPPPNAALPNSSIDLRVVGTAYEIDAGIDTAELSAVGVEFRGDFQINENVAVRTQYLFTQGDEIEVNGETIDGDFDIDVIRIGFVIQSELSGVMIYGGPESALFRLRSEGEKTSDNGYAMVAGLRDKGQNNFIWSVEIGYLDIEDSTGGLLDASFGYRLTPGFALVAGVQSYAVEDDGLENNLVNVSFGGKFRF